MELSTTYVSQCAGHRHYALVGCLVLCAVAHKEAFTSAFVIRNTSPTYQLWCYHVSIFISSAIFSLMYLFLVSIDVPYHELFLLAMQTHQL